MRGGYGDDENLDNRCPKWESLLDFYYKHAVNNVTSAYRILGKKPRRHGICHSNGCLSQAPIIKQHDVGQDKPARRLRLRQPRSGTVALHFFAKQVD